MDEAVGSDTNHRGRRVSQFAPPPAGKAWALAFVLIGIATVASRWAAFGNPVYQSDDQFYLHVGKAILDGQLPYVDVWDRKPLGLFLIYAAISLTGGDGVPDYQLISGLFAFATALVIWRLGSKLSSQLGALGAATAYLITLPTFSGAGGQSPIFYNLPIALAAYWTFDLLDRPNPRPIDRRAYFAMAFAGVAMSIKTVSVFEGIFFGLVALCIARGRGASISGLSRHGLLMILIAIAPLASFLACYAALGHADAYWFANVQSIFAKDNVSSRASAPGIARLILFLLPLACAGVVGIISLYRSRNAKARSTAHFLSGWLIAATIGFVAIPNFYDHYVLPLIVPLSVAAALAMRSPVRITIWLCLIGLIALFNRNIINFGTPRATAQYAKLVDAASSNLAPDRSLFVFKGPVLLYRSTGTRPLSSLVFPDHFISLRERSALGADPTAELERIIACRPSVIITDNLPGRDHDPKAIAMISQVLSRDYVQRERIALVIERFPGVVEVWGRRYGVAAIAPCAPADR